MLRITACTLVLNVVPQALPAELPNEITNSIGMRFKLAPSGDFLMGHSPWGFGNPSPEVLLKKGFMPTDDLRPRIRITEPFSWAHEVTRAEYQKVMGRDPNGSSEDADETDSICSEDISRYPVVSVSWNDAVKFCERLSAIEGKTYRLPSEAEWEYACRAGTTTKWSCGKDELRRFAWYSETRDCRASSWHERGKRLGAV